MTTELDNDTLEWAAEWIEGSLKGEPDQRVREFGKNMATTLRAAKIDARISPSAAPVVDDRFVKAFRDTAIKVHMGFRHDGPWEECEWIECEDRRKMIESRAFVASPDVQASPDGVANHIADGAIGCRNCGDTFERPVAPNGTVAACEDCGDASYSLVTPELLRLRQAIGWICDAADAAYIENSDNQRIHEIFNIAAQAAGLKRRLPDEHGRFDETSIG